MLISRSPLSSSSSVAVLLRASARQSREFARAPAVAVAASTTTDRTTPPRWCCSSSSGKVRAHSTLTEPSDPPPQSSSVAVRAERNASAFDAHYSYTHSDEHYKSLRSSRDPIVPHTVSPQRTLNRSNPIPRPTYASTGRVLPSLHPERILLHSSHSIERMTNAAGLARRMLDYTCSLARPGVTTDEIDRCVHQRILKNGAYPSPLNYAGFPKSLCSSVNEVICHGIPDSRELKEGDVVSFDVSCFVGGVHGDNCATVIVGDYEEEGESSEGGKEGAEEADEAKPEDHQNTSNGERYLLTPDKINEDGMGYDWRGVRQKSTFQSDEEALSYITARRLVRAARESLLAGISACKPGACLTAVGSAIHDVADAYGYGTVKKYRGHGISEEFHTAPFVKHYRNSDRAELREGMIFTIEPMITESKDAECEEWDDDWTVVALSGGRSAQFEHTVLITEDGVRILTLP